MKKLKKDAIGLTKASMITSVGASAATSVGGSGAGLSALSSSFPVMGTAVGAGASLRMLKKMKKKRR
jgi:hypothetical protein